MLQITVEELKAKLDAGVRLRLLDVREHEEVALCALPGAQHVPMLDLFVGAGKVDADPQDLLVVYCHHGLRSLEAASFLRAQGFQNAVSLQGGIEAWSTRIDPTTPRY